MNWAIVIWSALIGAWIIGAIVSANPGRFRHPFVGLADDQTEESALSCLQREG
jgi:hypothetical protein